VAPPQLARLTAYGTRLLVQHTPEPRESPESLGTASEIDQGMRFLSLIAVVAYLDEYHDGQLGIQR
jgi:hypothetical protein